MICKIIDIYSNKWYIYKIRLVEVGTMKTIAKTILSLSLICALLLSYALPAAATEQSNVKAATRATASWDVDGDGTLSILCIGNSFSVDAMQYVYQIAKNLGISSIYLGNLYIGGCTLATHYTNASGNKAAYTYYTNTSGSWSTTESYKMGTAISSRSWDYISMQQASGDSGDASTYNSNLTNLITYVKGKLKNSSTKLVWHMTWAYQGGSTKLANSSYSSQSDMYSKIISAVQSKIKTNSNFKIIVPNGTAIQNARTSLLKDNLTRDGYHLNKYIGRYIAGLTFVRMLTGLDISKVTYKPSGVGYALQQIAIESVNNAVDSPYAKTTSKHGNVTTSSLYARMYPQWKACSFWNSTTSTYNKQNTTASNAPYFFSTQRFDKTSLPVGSVIKVSSGWQYRPEGWESDAQQNSDSRPTNVSTSYVVALEEWWSSWTMRAFNVSNKTDNTSLKSKTADDINGIFQIYVPIENLNTQYYQLRIDITNGAYWQSTNATNYNKLTSGTDFAKQFFATQRFSKSELPAGSVIRISSGWQYRPEGWKTDAQQESASRPAICTERAVLITDSWWGSWTIRAFNASKQDESLLDGLAMSTLTSAFKIYVPASKHTHSNTTSTTAATCTAAGSTVTSCTVCTYSKTETIPALGHNYTESAQTDASCTAPATKTYVCSTCNDSYTENVGETLDHSYDTVRTDVEASCTEAGQKTLICGCGESCTEEIPALGHDEVIIEAVTANCTETGLTEGARCQRCNEILVAQETVAALGHDYSAVETLPTCTEAGFTTHTCEVCGDSYTADPVDATGHSYDDGTVTLLPTCTEAGEMTYVCGTCGGFCTESIEATGHVNTVTNITDATCTEDGSSVVVCSDCGETVSMESIPALGHSYSMTLVAPTCTERGCTVYLCICGDNYVTDYVDATGHSYETTVTEPTCTEDGSIVAVCSDCASGYTETIPATGHVNTVTNVTDATCTEDGSVVVTCACGEIVSTETVPALGHSYSTPDDNGDGTHTAACACGDAITEGHSFVDGTCICGAVEVTEPVVDGKISIGETLSLESDLTMNLRIKTSQLSAYDLSTAYLVVERDVYNSDGTMELETRTLTDYTIKDNRLVFAYTGISAAQMNDEIRAALYIKDANGKEYKSNEKVTSVAIYSDLMLGASAGNEKLITLIMDMLNYGTAAQIYYKRHADAPVNEAFESFKTYASYASTDLKSALEDLSGTDSNGNAGAVITQGLDLSTRVGITYKVKLPAGVDAADATLVVKDADGNALETFDLSTGTVDSKGRYVVTFFGSTSRDMRRMVYATVTVDGAAISDTYTYSIST